MILLDGTKLADEMLVGVKQRLQGIGRQLYLAIIQVGDDPATNGFIKMKMRAGEELGVRVTLHKFEMATKEEISALVQKLNDDSGVDGILVQLPLVGIDKDDEQEILNFVSYKKDVDVLGVEAIGRFRHGRHFVYPPVVGGIKAFFDTYGIEYRNKLWALVGGGKLVGSATNTFLKRRSEDVSHIIITKNYSSVGQLQKLLPLADIIVVGIPGDSNAECITAGMVKEGAIVIDAGFFRIGERRVGNVHFESVSKKASYITPVPGGVGPLTVSMVYYNLLELAKEQQ